VPEEGIAEAMEYAARELHLVVEGGGAVPLAALLSGTWTPTHDGGKVALVLSGGNVSAERMDSVLEAPG